MPGGNGDNDAHRRFVEKGDQHVASFYDCCLRSAVGDHWRKSASANPYFIQNVGPITNSGFISDLGLNDSGEMVGTNNEMAWSWTASGKLVATEPVARRCRPHCQLGLEDQ